MDEITINGQRFVPVAPPGNRHIVVVDRGWIFAGDLAEKDGRIILTRVVWLFGWKSCGMAEVVADSSKADIRKWPSDLNIPSDAEIFRCPVAENWGL